MNAQNLVGQRVVFIKTNMIGTIEKIEDNIMYISTRDGEYKYLYPDAFTSTLELENLEQQRVFEKLGYHASFDCFKKKYKNAIEKEIDYLRLTGGKKYRAIDGVRLENKNGEYLYAFDTDSDYHFPDSTPIKLWFPDKIVNAYITSCEDFTIMFRTLEYIGEEIVSIEFTSEQWILLEALMERLDEMKINGNSIAYELACKGRSKIKPLLSVIRGQNAALRRATSEKITFIWGPPGTGKTETLANIALEYIANGKRILMLSYSNVSVDGALLRVNHKADYQPGTILRYGYPRNKELLESKTLTSFQYVLNQNKDLAEEYYSLITQKKNLKKKDAKRKQINEKLQQIRRKLSAKEDVVVNNAAFLATTVSKAVIDKTIYTQNFDVVIFDEASMAYIPQIIFAGGLAKMAFICLGDFRQLPAIVQNKEDEILKEDIFEYTGIVEAVENNEGHEWMVMLNKQHRMHPDIASVVSDFMYNKLLTTNDAIVEKLEKIAKFEPVASEAISLIDISGMYSSCIKTLDQSRINLLSALISIVVADSYVGHYEVGIITPYSAQSRLILAMIRDLQEKDERYKAITCATVHQFQGSEKAVIIYDAVDCYWMQYPGLLLTEVKNNTANRLFNVAITRAKGKFILLANYDYLKKKKLSKNLLFTKVLNQAKNKDNYYNGDDLLEEYASNFNTENAILLNDREGNWKLYLNDLKNCKTEIYIDIPGTIDGKKKDIEDLGKILSDLMDKGIQISIRTDEDLVLPKMIRPFIGKYGYVTTPITIIDKRIVWFGHPFCAADFISESEPIETEYFPCIRFEGKYTARLLQAFYNL